MAQSELGIAPSTTNLSFKRKLSAPKKWSHLSELEKHTGKKIIIIFKDDPRPIEGDLLVADQFTIKAKLFKDATAAVYFKSAIKSYELIGG